MIVKREMLDGARARHVTSGDRGQLDEHDRRRLAELCVRTRPQLPDIAARFYAGVANAVALRVAFVDWLAGCLGNEQPSTIANKRARLAAAERELDVPRDTRIVRINVLRCELDDRVAELYDSTEAGLVARAVDKVLDRELAALVRECQHESDERHERSTVADRVVAIQTLSTGFAHELRNPLNSARLQLELLERRLHPADPRVTESLTAIDHELERLSRLLKEFLAFAHPNELALADSDLGELVGVVLTAERSFAESHGVQLAGPEPGCVVACVDVGKVTQVVQNLVRNAIEACKPGGHVGITLRGDREHVHLAVEDDGPGVPEAIRRRIYEPFFTTKDSGTGLGLSIAHSVVRQHGGTIELYSNDHGTRFELVLPRQPR